MLYGSAIRRVVSLQLYVMRLFVVFTTTSPLRLSRELQQAQSITMSVWQKSGGGDKSYWDSLCKALPTAGRLRLMGHVNLSSRRHEEKYRVGKG